MPPRDPHDPESSRHLPSSYWLDDPDLLTALTDRSLDLSRVRQLVLRAFRRTLSAGHASTPTDDELADCAAWLRRIAAEGNLHEIGFGFLTMVPSARSSLYVTMADKVTLLAQRSCSICPASSQGPGRAIVPVLLPPRSFRNLERGYVAALREAFRNRQPPVPKDFFESKLCIALTFVLSPDRRKLDVDNLAKLLLDGMTGSLYRDDSQIDHLDVAKITVDSSQLEHAIVHVRHSTLNDHQDVLDREFRIGFAVGPVDPLPYLNNSSSGSRKARSDGAIWPA